MNTTQWYFFIVKVGLPDCELSLHSDSAVTSSMSRDMVLTTQLQIPIGFAIESVKGIAAFAAGCRTMTEGGPPSAKQLSTRPNLTAQIRPSDQISGSTDTCTMYMYFPHRVSQALGDDTPR